MFYACPINSQVGQDNFVSDRVIILVLCCPLCHFSNLISLNLTLIVKEKKNSNKVKILMSICHYSPQISPLHSCLHFPNLFFMSMCTHTIYLQFHTVWKWTCRDMKQARFLKSLTVPAFTAVTDVLLISGKTAQPIQMTTLTTTVTKS